MTARWRGRGRPTRRHRAADPSNPGTVLVVHPGAELYGSDRMMLESVRGLRDAGHPVVVVLPTRGPLEADLAATGAQVRILDMPVLRKAYLSPGGLLTLGLLSARTLLPTLRLMRSTDPVAVYVSTLTLPTWLILARLTGRWTVCHVHEAERHRSRLVATGLMLPLLAAHRLILNSAYSASIVTEVLARLGPRIQVVYNGVAGPGSPSPARKQLDGALRVLYVGRLSPRKGVDVAVAAVRAARRDGVAAELDVVGSAFTGYEWFESRLRSENTDLMAVGALRLHGFTSDIWAALAAADVVVVPSTLPEPFGNTAVEAMLAGRPVLVSAVGGLPEAIEGCPSAMLLPAGDVTALADALAAISVDWSTVSPAAHEHAARAASRFSPDVYRRTIIAVVDGLAWQSAR